MNTVRFPCLTWAASAAVVVGLAPAARAAEAPAPPAAAAAPAPVAEPGLETVGDDEGPFAPKGRTGKLKREALAATPESKGGEAAEIDEHSTDVGLDLVYGFGKGGSETGAVDVKAYAFVLGGRYKLSPRFALGARVPFTSVTEGSGSTRSDSAVGNVEVAAEYAFEIAHGTELPIELALLVPTAGGDEFAISDPALQTRALVNGWAAAARGLEDDALYATHRFGIVPKVAIERVRHRYSVGAYEKLELGVRAGGVDPRPDDHAKINALAVTNVVEAHGWFGVLPERLEIGLRAWVTAFVKDEITRDTLVNEPSKAQFVLEPGVRFRYDWVRLGLGYLAPIGGRLSGDTGISGLRLTAGGAF